MKNLILLLLFSLSLFSCDLGMEAKSDEKARVGSEKMMNEAMAKAGLPNIKNFQMRKWAKLVQELCDREKMICHAYIDTYTGIHYIGRCYGYGLPYSTQYTNPEKRIWSRHSNNYTLPQAEPNGLFLPDNSSATWLMLLPAEGSSEPRPVYIESKLIVSPVPLNLKGLESSY